MSEAMLFVRRKLLKPDDAYRFIIIKHNTYQEHEKTRITQKYLY